MKFFKGQSIHERKIGDQSVILTSTGDVEINPPSGNIRVDGNVTVTGNISGPEVTDILYVNQDGSDENDGRSMGPDGAKRTVKGAVAVAQPGTTIIVAPGDYYEDNPISLPDFVTITGQGELRNTRLWPNNNTEDFFYMGNGCYLYQLTFRGLRAPGWVVKIRPGTLCTVSPYVQNCTNMNGPWLNDGTEFIPFETVQIDGITPGARPLLVEDYPQIPFDKQVNDTGGGGGMLVDGDQYNPASLVKSFVADAFTQISQGGPGFEITNFGYTQIVSCFTVFCSTGFKTTRGGYLSISNSVSDFGTYGCVADGYYPTSYTSARPVQDYYSSVASITVTNPGIGYTSAPLVTIDAPTGTGGVQATASAVVDPTTGLLAGVTVLENGSGYETVPQVTFSGGNAIVQAEARINLQTNSIIRIGSLRDKPQVGSIINIQGDPTFYYIVQSDQIVPPFFYDEEVCRRDTAYIIDAVLGDIVMGTNYQSIAAGRSYLRSTSSKVLADQIEPTIYAIEAARDEMKTYTSNVTVQNLIDDKFAIIINFLRNEDSSAAPDITYNDLSTIDVGVRRAKDNIVENKAFIVEEITKYIQQQFTELSYNKPQFSLDVDSLLKGTAFYITFGSNYHVVRDGQEYSVRPNQRDLYLDAWRRVKTAATSISQVSSDPTSLARTNEALNTFINIWDDGDSAGITIEFPDHLGVEANRRDSKDQLQANKDFLTDEFISYLKSEHPLYTAAWTQADEDAHVDDFAKIIDALSYDIMYQGNSGTVKEAFRYFERRSISSLVAIQRTRLADAFARMRSVIKNVVREGIVIPSPGNTTPQDFTSEAATSIEADSLDSLLFNFEDMILENTTTRLPLISYPTYDSELIGRQNAASTLLASISGIVSTTESYILDNYPDLTFDSNKCERDVGYIIDAVYRDALLNTNHNSITAAQAYTRSNTSYLNAQQKPATIIALREAARLSSEAVTLDTYIQTQVRDRWEDILNIIEYDQYPSEGRVFESPGPASQNLINAVSQIINNREFLTKEVTAYINNVYDNGSGTLFVYDQDKCYRDAGLILDAVIADIAFGTNYNAVTAGLAYQRAGSAYVQSDQKTETIAAITYLKGLSKAIANADATAELRNDAAFDEIIDIINNGVVSTDTSADALSFPIPTGAAATITAARDKLQANRNFLAEDVSRYVINNYPDLLNFDKTKCERDTGLILDAVGMDIALGTNYNSVTAGLAYQRAGSTYLQGNQKTETIGAINYARDQVLALTSVSGDTTSTTRAGAGFAEIVDILNNGVGSADALNFSIPSVLPTTDADDANNRLVNNRTFIITEIISYIDYQIANATLGSYYQGFTYDSAACSRDVGYIVDALSYDILYGGNSAARRAAEAYFVGTASQLGANETQATLDAYAHLDSILSDIVLGNAITPTPGNGLSQDTTGNNATATETAQLTALLNIIETVISDGNLGNLPSETLPSVTWAGAAVQASRAEIISNRTSITNLTTNYIIETYDNLTFFDVTKCERDIKYIVDALTYDIVYGGNTATRRAAQAYFENAITQVPNQQFETAGAINHLQTIIDDIVLGNAITPQTYNYLTQDTSGANAGATEAADLQTLVQVIEDVVEFGTDTLPAESYPSTAWVAAGVLSARQDIIDQKTTLQTNTINFVNTTYNGFTYDQETCERDTRLIIDALTHDLLYTGNIAILIATRAYFLGNTQYLPTEQAAITGAAFAHLADVVGDVLQGVIVTPSTGNSETQSTTGNYGSAIEAALSDNLLQIIEDAVTNQTLAGTPGEIQPNVGWLSLVQRNAGAQLLGAKASIQTSVTDYIFENIVDFDYDVVKCQRDTAYIIDSILYDLMYGGNKQTRRAGIAYYNGAILNNSNNYGTADQTAITAFTYRYLGEVLKDVAQNNVITKSVGNILTQDISIPDGSLEAGNRVLLLADRIAQAVDEGSTAYWSEVNHNYSLGNSVYNTERVAILNKTEDIVDAAIKDLNATYGGTYDVTVSPGLITVQQDTLAALYNVSTISTSGHAFEYVGAGITYNALPFFGGSPEPDNEIIQNNQGKVFAGGTVDQIGNFRVGDFFAVNALTGAITLDANQIDLNGLTSVGPFIRDGIPVGVELKEVSNNPNLTASNGIQDINTSPTQAAVATYVENRYLNKLTGGTVNGDVQFDGDINITGGDLTTDVTTFNLLNTTAETINFGGDATAINIGNATGLVTINPDMLVEGTLTVNGNITFVGDVALTIPDASLQAYSITVGTEDYISINTREHEEKVTFGEQPKIEIQNDSESTSITTGALVVDGGIGIRKNTFIGGILEVDGNVRLGSERNEDSIDINAIVDIDVPDNTVDVFRIHENLSDYISINTTDNNELIEFGSTPLVTILNLTNATSATTGALTVTGGISSERNIHAGVDITADQDLIAGRDAQINGTNITTDETGTFNVFNTNATTINAFGDATTISIGAATGTVTINPEITIFSSVAAIQIPVGTTADKTGFTAAQGQIRYNTTDSSFEGYDGSNWSTLGGVKDVNQDTYIIPETSPGANNDELEFYTNGTRRLKISNTEFNLDSSVTAIINNTTSSTTVETGALTIAGGVGIIENLHVGGYISGTNAGQLQLTDLQTDNILIPSDRIELPNTASIVTNNTVVDDIVYPISLVNENSSGTPLTGIGVGIKFNIETANDNIETGGQIDIVSTDITGTQEDFDMVFSTMIGGTAAVEKFRLSETVSTLTTDLAINNDTLSTDQTTFNLLNTTATTVNFAGAATVLNIGATGGLTTIDQNVQVNEDVTIDGTLTLTNIDLEVQYGGTGVSTFTENGILYGDTANPVQVTAAAGTSDASESFQILTVTSAVDATPVWTDTIDGGSF